MTKSKVQSVKVETPTTHEEAMIHFNKEFYLHDAVHSPEMPVDYLQVGQRVEVGALDNCTVVGFLFNKLVVVHHLARGRDIPPDTYTYGVFSWHGVYPLNLAAISIGKKSELNSYSSTSVDGLIFKVLHFGVNFSPIFQREYVWSQEDKDNLIDSVMNGIDIGRFVFVKQPYPLDDLIIDGKQRLSTLVDFYLGKFPYKGKYFYQLSKQDRRLFENHPATKAEMVENTTKLKMLKVFLEVNRGGVPVTEEHLATVQKMYDEELLNG